MNESREPWASFIAAARERLDGSRLRRDVPLAPYTTFRIGGPADLVYDATAADDLANAVLLARRTGTPYFDVRAVITHAQQAVLKRFEDRLGQVALMA